MNLKDKIIKEITIGFKSGRYRLFSQQSFDAEQSFLGLDNARTGDVTDPVVAYVSETWHCAGCEVAKFVPIGVVRRQPRQFEAGFGSGHATGRRLFSADENAVLRP